MKSYIHKWWHQFSGKKSSKDDTHPGCLVTHTMEENVLLWSHMYGNGKQKSDG